MTLREKLLLGLIAAPLVFSPIALTGCEQDSEMEEAAEEAGSQMKDAADEAGEAVEDAGDAMQ